MSSNLDKVLKDFRVFLFLVWKHLNLPPPTPIQYEIAEYLQHGPRRQIIEAFRGCGKSWITSAFVLWSLLRNPQDKFLIVSASQVRAIDFSTFTLRLINEMPLLQHLKPDEDRQQRNSKVNFDVGPALAAHTPSVKSIGIFGAMAGSRATHIIGDDVEVPNNSATKDMRDKLLKAVTEFDSIIMPEVGRISFLGTPQTEESIYNVLANERQFSRRIWPARYPDQGKAEKMYGGSLAPSIQEKLDQDASLVGRATDTRFSEEELLGREMSIGRSNFALQFMLDTSLSDADRYPLKCSDLIVMSLDIDRAPVTLAYGSSHEQVLKGLPEVGLSGDKFHSPMFIDREWTEYTGSVMAIDPSGRGKDLTTYAIMKYLNGWLYCLDVGGFQGGYEDTTLEALAKLAAQYKVNAAIVEANYGDGMFTKLFQPVLLREHKCKLEEVKHYTQKEVRIIDTIEPVLNRHKLVMDLEIIKREWKSCGGVDGNLSVEHNLFYQLTRITRDRHSLKHDDKIDVLAIAIRYWVESMSRDEKLAKEDHQQRLLDKELKAHIKACKNSPIPFKADRQGNPWRRKKGFLASKHWR